MVLTVYRMHWLLKEVNPSGTLPSHPRVKRLSVRSSDKEEKMEIEKADSNHFIMEDQRRI